MRLSLESPNVGALVLPLAGALVQHRDGEMHAAGRGRRTCADGQLGFPRNLGDPAVSVLKRGSEGGAAPKPPGSPVRAGTGGRHEATGTKDGIAKRRKRSAARRTAGSRSALIV